MIWDMFRCLNLYHADPTQHLIAVIALVRMYEDDLDRDLCDLSDV